MKDKEVYCLLCIHMVPLASFVHLNITAVANSFRQGFHLPKLKQCTDFCRQIVCALLLEHVYLLAVLAGVLAGKYW